MKDNEEYCPFCDKYTEFDLTDIDKYGLITCSNCGKKILACSVCELDVSGDCNGCSHEHSKFWNDEWAEKQEIK